jgi:hypothetical protein
MCRRAGKTPNTNVLAIKQVLQHLALRALNCVSH